MKPVQFPSQIFGGNTSSTFNKFPVSTPIPRDSIFANQKTSPIQDTHSALANSTTNEDIKKAEENILNSIEEYIKRSENNYNTQKTDLVNLINETLSNKHNDLKIDINGMVDKKMNEFITNNSNMINSSNAFSAQQPIQTQTPMVVEKAQPKGKYYKLPANLFAELQQQYKDIPQELADSAFIKNNEKFIKTGTKYIKVDESGIAKIMDYYSKKK
jgi:hypothetical protein